MPDTLRSSGIPFIDEVPWGSHLCVFYETRDDLIDAAARFFEQGLDNNELCAWALPAPLQAQDAAALLNGQVADLDAHIAAGRMRFIAPAAWHALDGALDPLIADALDRGHAGLRIGGERHGGSAPSEDTVARLLAGRPALALSTCDLTVSRGADVLEATRLHSLTVARRGGEWQPFETPSWRVATDLEAALAAMASAFPGHEHLTDRERSVLELLLRGASSKEVARDLGISPRTADFHRANIIGKLGARNTADVVRRVFSRR
ncbi:MAG TPA: MEDS domain-containing protein [Pseudolabrys sp.]|nr:MEDS domain-containing protein [Pseudolabrys sp.]